MSKFKVGDRVRVIKSGRVSGGSFHGAEIGEEFTLTNVGGSFVSTNVWDFYPHEIEHIYTSCAAAEVDNLADEYGGSKKAEFKKGDRIRVIKLGAGGSYHSAKIGDEFTVTEVEDCLGETEIYTDGDWYFYPSEIEHVTTPATTLRIEAGKFYKTRDGRKVGPMEAAAFGGFYDNRASITSQRWEDDGSYIKGCVGTLDLIAEWADEPVTAEPKFNVGDKVGCTTNRRATYVIKGVNGDKVDVSYVMDSGEEASHIYRDQDVGIFFARPVPTTIADIVARHSQTGTAIVAVLENGQPRPATRPYVHGSTHLAETEANRLARTNPGKEFGVYTLGTVAKVEKTYDHEWQRLAAGGRKIAAIKDLRGKTGLGLATAKDAVEDWLQREDLMRAA